MMGYYIGLMSGTSLDGVDAVLTRIASDRGIQVCGSYYRAFDSDLQQTLQQHCFAQTVSIQALGELDARLGELFARSALELIRQHGLSPHQISAIGSHGQTLYHRPDGRYPFTWQIGDPNRIAELTGITTVADFRRRDIAAGGQGAPLVPAFHRAIFHSPREDRAVLNLGGIANITVLPADPGRQIVGFDTGPGNTLLNRWISRHLGQRWDQNGRWAGGGKLHRALLEKMLEDHYFNRPPPKSSGPEYFSLEWLAGYLQQFPAIPPQDVQTTLTHLTAVSVTRALETVSPRPQRLLVCGGGVHNQYLIQLLQRYCCCPVTTTAHYGIDPDQVEAVAFAWLAWRTLSGKAGNLPAVTGARREVILGAVYPA